MDKRYLWLFAAVVWCAAIFIVTASPASTGGSTRKLFETLLHLEPEQAAVFNFYFRKGVHLGAFGLLAVLFYKGFREKRFFYAWLLTTVYAASDELHQFYVPGRTASILDVTLDSAGALLALQFAAMYERSRKKTYP